MNYRVPFNKPCGADSEKTYVLQAISDGRTSGDGPFTRRCEKFFEEWLGVNRALLTTSCTSALELAGLLCELNKGDEVILPSYTFVSTANAIMLRGARPVFVDIRPDTLNLDESRIEEAITTRTRGIWPVHYAGVGCEMDRIMEIASRHRLLVVEDAAQAVDAAYRDRWLGTIGDLGCYSFHETKNFSCGEGGALIVNAERFRGRAEILREKGTNRSQFLRGQVDKYTWVDVGSSLVPSDILAAHLLAQLERMEQITEKRSRVFSGYQKWLAPLVDRGLCRTPVVPPHCRTNFHMFYLLVENIEIRTALIEHLRGLGIQAVFHYIPLHTAPIGQSLGGRKGQLPVTEDASDRLLRLPMHCDLSDSDVECVARGLFDFYQVKCPE